MRQTTKAIVVVLAVLGAVSCGGSKGPTAPSVIQVAGLWRGPLRLTSVTGGECVGPIVQTVIGSTSTQTLSIQQTGSTLTARSTDVETGTTCDMTGTAGQNAISLNTTRCDIEAVRITCAPGIVRDAVLQAATVQATVSGNSGSGTYGETYNIINSFTGTGVGLMTTSSSLTMTRQ